jgi:hypothetical protein
MSAGTAMKAARVYVRKRAKALQWQEHTDGFNADNIPSTKVDRAFFIAEPRVSVNKVNVNNTTFFVAQELQLYLKGFRDPKTKMDLALVEAERVANDLVDPRNALTQVEVKQCFIDGLDLAPLDNSNDNVIVARIQTRALVIVETLRG